MASIASTPIASSTPSSLDPLLQSLQSPVNAYLHQFVHAQTATIRAQQLALMRRNDLYYNGKQYLALVNAGGYLDYRPVTNSTSLSPSGVAVGQQLYDYVLNVMKGDIWKFVAVLGSRAPNFTAQARDPKDEGHNSRRITADRAAHALRFHWKLDEVQPALCMILAKYGTAFSYVRFTSDPSRFGSSSIPEMEQIDASGPGFYQCFNCGAETPENEALALSPGGQPVCSRCGQPQFPESLVTPDPVPSLRVKQTRSYPNGSVDFDLATAATVNAPYWVPQIEKLPWLLYEFRQDKGMVARAIPDYREVLRREAAQSSPLGAMEDYTRAQIQSPTGFPEYSQQNSISQTLYSRLFISPWGLEYLPSDPSGNLREQIESRFPNGVMLTLLNNKLVRMEGRRIASHWAVCRATPSESLFSPAYFDEYIQGQDVINDAINAIIEAMERSTPITVVSGDLFDKDRFKNAPISHGEFLFTKPGVGTDIARQVYRLQAASVDPALFQVIDSYLERLRENHGILPAIWGGADDPTARQTDVNRNQALQMLSTPWNSIRGFMARTLENGAMELARNAYSDQIYLESGTAGEPETLTIPGIQDLTNGGWYYETDLGMPMTAGQRRDWVMQLMQQVGQSDGALAGFLGLDNPENRKRFQEAMGFDWTVPGVAERARVLSLIQRLLQEEPIQQPPPIDPLTGMQIGPPPPPEPSIPYDPMLFDPALDLAVVKEWIMSDEGAQAEESNPGGYANLLAWAMQIANAAKPSPEPIQPKLSFSGKLEDMVPEQEAAVLEKAGISFSGGTAGPGGPPPIGPPPGMGGGPVGPDGLPLPPTPINGGGPDPSGVPDGPPVGPPPGTGE